MMTPGNYEIRFYPDPGRAYKASLYLFGTSGWVHYQSFAALGPHTLDALPNDLYRLSGSVDSEEAVRIVILFQDQEVRQFVIYPDRPRPQVSVTLGDLSEDETGPLAALQMECEKLGREIRDFLQTVGTPANEEEVRHAMKLSNRASNLRGQLTAAYGPAIRAHQKAWRDAEEARDRGYKAMRDRGHLERVINPETR